MKKRVADRGGADGLFVETALLACRPRVVLVVAAGRPATGLPNAGAGQRCCWRSGVATAVPLLLFAAAARRLPLSRSGCCST